MDVAKITYDLLRDEGLRLKPYRDSVGKLTIGIGRNLDDVGISNEEARMLLAHDIEKVENQLISIYPWYEHLTEARQRALCNICFNVGLVGLTGFKKAITAMSIGEYDEASKQFLDSKWAKQVGQRAIRITALIRNGQ